MFSATTGPFGTTPSCGCSRLAVRDRPATLPATLAFLKPDEPSGAGKGGPGAARTYGDAPERRARVWRPGPFLVSCVVLLCLLGGLNAFEFSSLRGYRGSSWTSLNGRRRRCRSHEPGPSNRSENCGTPGTRRNRVPTSTYLRQDLSGSTAIRLVSVELCWVLGTPTRHQDHARVVRHIVDQFHLHERPVRAGHVEVEGQVG